MNFVVASSIAGPITSAVGAIVAIAMGRVTSSTDGLIIALIVGTMRQSSAGGIPQAVAIEKTTSGYPRPHYVFWCSSGDPPLPHDLKNYAMNGAPQTANFSFQKFSRES